MLWLIIEISLISLVYIFLYGNPLGNFINDLIFSTKYTVLGICLPYSFAVLIIYYKNQRVEIKNLQKRASKPAEKRLLAFKDESGKIKFSVQAKDVLVLESTDNYVSVYYILENKVNRKLLRNTLKNLEEMLAENSIVRCHRSFMVQTQNIDFIEKTGKKINLRIKQMNKTIPVSKNYSSKFIDLLN
jgi:DNA-binding LytR/AlgR family response regulator